MTALILMATALWSLVCFAFNCAFNSKLSEYANKHPKSLFAKTVRFFAELVELLIVRTTTLERTEEVNADLKQPARRTVMDALNFAHGFSVRQSFVVGINTTRRMPKWLARLAGGNLPLSIKLILATGGLVLLTEIALLSLDAPGSFVFWAMALEVLFLAGPVVYLMSDEDSFLFKLEKLGQGAFAMVTVDDESIRIDGPWVQQAFCKNNEQARFEAQTDGVKRKLILRTDVTPQGFCVFDFPKFMEASFMTTEQLAGIADKLNTLMARAREMPAIQYDELRL